MRLHSETLVGPMSENNGFELVRKPSSAVEKSAPDAKHILSGMVADALVLAQPIFTVLMCDNDPTSDMAEVAIKSNWAQKYSIRFIRFNRDTELLKLTQEPFSPYFLFM